MVVAVAVLLCMYLWFLRCSPSCLIAVEAMACTQDSNAVSDYYTFVYDGHLYYATG